MSFINKTGTEAEIEFIIVCRGRHHGKDLPGTNVADAYHMVADLRPDIGIFRDLHIACGNALLAEQTGGNAGRCQKKEQCNDSGKHAHRTGKPECRHCNKSGINANA